MEQASLRLMQAMKHSVTDIKVLSLHPVGGLGTLLDTAGIPTQGLNYWGPAGVGVIPQMFPILRQQKTSNIVMTGPHVAAMMAMKAAGVRGSYLAVHFHHTGVKPRWVWCLIYRLALDRFNWITFPSDFVRDEACEILPTLRDRSLTIRLPQSRPADISTDQRRKARIRFGIPENAFVIGNAGWLIRRKRFDVFLEVAARITTIFPDAKFIIAGGGEEEQALKSLAKSLGIDGNVIWLGWQQDLTDFWSVIDVLLFNADWDALPVTPQEAVCRGIPIVASLIHGGLREVFDDALAERILGSHDIDELVSQILAVRNDPDGSSRAAQVSRDHYLHLSDPSVIAAQHLDLLVNRA
jgi:glycosyltransferase involved in cell wall biosynthesis